MHELLHHLTLVAFSVSQNESWCGYDDTSGRPIDEVWEAIQQRNGRNVIAVDSSHTAHIPLHHQQQQMAPAGDSLCLDSLDSLSLLGSMSALNDLFNMSFPDVKSFAATESEFKIEEGAVSYSCMYQLCIIQVDDVVTTSTMYDDEFVESDSMLCNDDSRSPI